ncbi:hypothetical protein K0M31_017111 [Melipona bicolor]|uniref:Uncharacterized protein n=1 Tax=Melipona bicolor TaxID=60889 RepID=A0AA40FEC0_9HYME|nr:hypothetical protein K0M31_017111 [Melipona bicolor]
MEFSADILDPIALQLEDRFCMTVAFTKDIRAFRFRTRSPFADLASSVVWTERPTTTSPNSEYCVLRVERSSRLYTHVICFPQGCPVWNEKNVTPSFLHPP